MIATREQYNFTAEKQYEEWCTGGPWFNKTIFQYLHGPLSEELSVTAREDRYDIMCRLHASDKRKEKSIGATYFHGGRPLPEDSNINTIISLCVTKCFIEAWIYTLDKNIALLFLAYQDKMKHFFQKIPKEVKQNY